MAVSEYSQLISINACLPNVASRVNVIRLNYRHLRQGSVTILANEVTNLPTETGTDELSQPPLALGLYL